MSLIRNAIRALCFVAVAVAIPISASADNFEIRALIDVDNSRSTGCNITTPGGIVSGIDTILTTDGTVSGTTATVTAVTRQTCVNPAANLFSTPVAVDSGWTVGVSSIGDLLIESHLGPGVITLDNIRTPRFVFTATSGIFSDALLTPFSWGGGDIILPLAARDRAVATRGLRKIILDGNGSDWDGVPPLATGTANSPAWRFISVSADCGLTDLFFNFQIHTNPAAPTAHDDVYALPALGGTLTVSTLGVLNNDDPNHQPVTATLVDGPKHGTVTLNPNGGFTYTNDGALVPQDQFRYVLTGTPLLSNIATVTIEMPGSHPYVFTSADHVTFNAGQFNSFLVTVTGKPTPALSEDGVLPSGITFHDNGDGTGTLSGTAASSTVGTYAIVFNAEKNKPHQASQNFTLTVACPTITVTNPVVNTGTVGTPFSQTFTQVGGSAPITWSKSGTLPNGLTFHTATGVLDGTPTQGGTFPIIVTATDANGCTGTGATYTLIINCNSIIVTNPAVNSGTVNVPFSQTFTQVGGIGATTFSLFSGALPTGLTLASNGTLSGTPTQKGSFPIVVRATDSNGCAANGPTYTLTIGCQVITVTNPATNTGTVNVAFSQTFTAGNTIAPVTFTLNSGTLPAGLSLSTGGVLSGTPTQTGSFPITVKATDANGCFGVGATYTLTVGCQVITVNNPATNSGTVNVAFSQTFTAGNAIAPVTFTLNSGTLPAGLTLSSAGVLSGTPTQTGSFPITVKATDANGCTGVGATYTLTIGCQVITVTNPATTTGTVNIAFSQTFTAGNTIGAVTFSLNSGTLPTGLSLSSGGVLSGTPTQSGSFPITVKATDANGCTGAGATYTLVIGCQVITVTNPATTTGTVNVAFSQTFTAGNTIGAVTFSLNSGTLPTGLSLSAGGVLSGTPTQTGSFPITVKATDANGCTGTGTTYTLVIGCQVITVTNPATNTGTANAAFSQTFTAGNAIAPVTFTINSGTLPVGLSLSSGGVLSGTPTQTGSFPITVKATDVNGCFAVGATYTLTIGCQVITVTNPATTTGTVNIAFSQTFTAGNTVGAVTFSLNSGTLPTGLSLSSGGVLSGTPTQKGSFPITVKATDANGCTGTGATYTLVIGCQTITVTNPANNTGTINVPFSETFTAGNTIGAVTFTINSGTLPTGLSLSSGGVLAGTPAQPGSFPITVKATDANGCFGVSATYTIIIACQTITVTNPATTTGPAGTPFNVTFTQSGGIGTTTFSESGTLPTGMNFHTGTGVLDGTPTQGGTFPITVTATDSNGCQGTGPTYSLVITCPTITVTNPGVSTGTAGTLFSQTFSQSGGTGTITWSETGALPSGISINTASGVLSGTTSQVGTFPITVTATDQNGCTGTGATYNLTINCQTVTVTNPGVNTGTVDAPFSQTFSVSGILGTVTWSETGALPANITLNPATGVLSGTPTVPGSFPITVKATDTNGCFGTSSYTLTINCQTITVTKPGVTTGTVDAPFSQSFTQSGVGTHTPATFTLNSGSLPPGLSLSTAGVLSGTPSQPGSFPMTVKVTDVNGCSGVSTTYTLVIGCQTITVTNPATTTGTVNVAFSQTFTQSGVGTHTPANFSTASTLPTGFSLSAAGVLSGTTQQHNTFPIVVTVTDANGCTGTGSTYNLVINCQTITVTNPGVTTGTVGTPFSQSFSQTGGIGATTFSTASTLPNGITLSSAGLLAGTPTQAGSFPIVVTATDSNGCTGSGATYTLVIACNVITVTNPGVTTGTVDAAFSQSFGQTGANGTATFTLNSGSLPAGLSLSTAGVLSGTPSAPGSSSITVKVTDSNGCTGISPTYTLVISCQTITVNSPGVTTGTVDTPFSQSFTQTGVGTHTPATFSLNSGSLPSGMSLSAAGLLSGTPGQPGSFPITVKVTDANNCSGISATYTLVIACQTITVTNPATTSGVFNTLFSQTFTQSGVGTHTPANFTINSGTLPNGLSLSSAGVLSGTPTQTGTFPITVKVTDVNGCTGIGATYNLVIAPNVQPDTYNNLVDNTQFVLTGGATSTPGTPSVQFAGTVVGNDTPNGGVSVTAGTFVTNQGGSVTIASDGTFLYTPAVHASALAQDTFSYTASSNTGGTATPATAIGSVTLNLANRVWYVKDNGGAGNGQSQSPFNALPAVQAAATANDIIFIYAGNTSTTPLSGFLSLQNGAKLWGEPFGLTVNSNALVSAGATQPRIKSTANGVPAVSVDTSAATASDRTSVEIRQMDLEATGTTTSALNVTSNAAHITSVTIAANNIRGATAQGINLNQGSTAAFDATITGTSITSTGNGIQGRTNTAGTMTITASANTITTSAGNGVDIRTVAGASALHISLDSEGVTAAGNGILIDGSVAGTTTITSFLSNNINGNTTGTGISVTSATFDTTPGGAFQTVSGGTTVIGASGNGVGAAGMVLTSVAGDLSFTDLDIFTSAGTGLFASGTTPYTGSAGFQIAVSAGVATVTAAGGPAVNLSNVKGNSLPFVTISSSGSPTTGVALNSFLGSFSAGSGSTISGATGTSFQVGSSNATITYDGTISSAAGKGVDLTSNSGSTISFTGALTMSSGSNNTFNATGGGTVTSTNTNSTLTSTTGTALNVTSTTIGAGGLIFKSISANGGSNGIVLNTTGASGGLTVNGDGANTSVGGNSTGGTISNMSGSDLAVAGSGIYLNSTASVVLRRMTINGTNQNFGIRGLAVNGFTLEYSTVSGTNGTSASADTYGEGSVFFGDASTNGLTGTGTFTNDSISGGRERNLSIVNGGAVSTTTVTVKGCTFGAMLNFSDGNQSVAVEARTSGSTLNTVFGGPAAGEPNTLTNAVSDLANFTGQTGTTMDVQFKNNTLSNNNPNNIIGGGSLNFSAQGAMTFDVDSNSMRDANGSAVTLFKASSGTSLTGKFTNNTIGNAGVVDSGSKTGNGIFVSAAGTGTMGFTITGNQIHQIHGNSHIYADNTGGSYTANFTITGNTLDTPGAGWFAGMAITNGAQLSTDTVNVCATIGGLTAGLKNTINVAGGLGVIVGSSGAAAGHTFNLPTYAGGASFTNVQNFIQGNNTGSFTTTAYADAPATAAAFTGSGTSCPTP
jgi:hypothetical protein